ncbi:MAG: fluoride efflux transporter CrcB [Polyangiaceae bacterium]|nr:fluoride efflux transporter CrcB [Myxococcales bacterium]MCB9584766.1 fluoride efflux transporter CrcB [Polyangiaceae bacterium]MCB9607661.1 fluoride efflux transporter CrcB [Polyangiaceae bacterium]
MLKNVALVALGGSLGALARWSLGLVVSHWFGTRLPWATISVNVLGSLLFGVVWAVTEPRMPGSAAARLILLTGFMGAFTTFSTYAFETVQMLRDGQFGGGLFSMLLQNGVGFVAIVAGLGLGRWVAGA